MSDTTLLDASCRVALAAFLHDIGKFAERAGIEVSAEILEANVHQYCPRHEERGRVWHSHKHAAYTAIALDRIEPHLPRLKGANVTPFAAWGSAEADDSLINAAARHHRPETFLQWVVATADRVASGFDRESFEAYDRGEGSEAPRRLDHYTARQLTLFEQIRLGDGRKVQDGDLKWRYPLVPLSAAGIFPVEVEQYENHDRASARAEYRRLWDDFEHGLASIPKSHRTNLALWLDHFDSLWACYTHAIPSATAFRVRPDVSLYDHAKTVAALATALWRFHHDSGGRAEDDLIAMRGYRDWDENKFLLVQGDLFGIQDFIFATGGETQRRAAKLLRGRSFYVGLLTECAALKILDALDLPSTSQIINAAGKFLIVAPNLEATRARLNVVRQELDAWLLQHTCGQAGVGIAWQGASCSDFRRGSAADSPFRVLMERLFEQLEDAKLQRFGLCGASSPGPLFEGFLERFTHGACAVDGRMPAEEQLADGIWVSKLARDQIDIGGALVGRERLMITREPLFGDSVRGLRLPVLGYGVAFTGGEDQSGRFGPEAQSGNLLRSWDFSLPEQADEALFQGYARRYINAYVPRFDAPNAWEDKRYDPRVGEDDFDQSPGAVKTFGHLACEARSLDAKKHWIGTPALMTLKGDVDNLGQIFQSGLDAPSFARMAALSRQMHGFFSIYLPWMCHSEFPSTYTVFAGGDDFFLIGPWRQQVRLAQRLREEFDRYVARNPDVHFSSGLLMTKAGLPVRYLATAAERALESAKHHRATGDKATKNAVTCFGETVAWPDFVRLLSASDHLNKLTEDFGLSTRYLHGLLELLEMAENVKSAKAVHPEDARWRAHFHYRTYRMLERSRMNQEQRKQVLAQLASVIAKDGIERFGRHYRIALFSYLYQQRD